MFAPARARCWGRFELQAAGDARIESSTCSALRLGFASPWGHGGGPPEHDAQLAIAQLREALDVKTREADELRDECERQASEIEELKYRQES